MQNRNHAADPESFKVSKANLMRIAKTAIGRPWLPGKPKGQNLKHFRTPPADLYTILSRE